MGRSTEEEGADEEDDVAAGAEPDAPATAGDDTSPFSPVVGGDNGKHIAAGAGVGYDETTVASCDGSDAVTVAEEVEEDVDDVPVEGAFPPAARPFPLGNSRWTGSTGSTDPVEPLEENGPIATIPSSTAESAAGFMLSREDF